MELAAFEVKSSMSIRDAIKKLDKGGKGFLAVIKNHKIYGIITDGDFRRAILNGVDLTDQIESITNTKYTSLSTYVSDAEIREIFTKKNIRHLPIVKDASLVDIIFRDEYFSNTNYIFHKTESSLSLPVVIMAGGQGSRLTPFTEILPKPLIPIAGKPIIEVIMSKFSEYGMNEFYISVNHKGRMIKVYFEDKDLPYKIKFIDENKPLGTAGALKYLQHIETSFFVTNCDIIINTNYADIYKFHKEGKYDFTLVCSLQHHVIPYGVCEIENGGDLKDIKEKPEYDFLVNTGLYLLNPNVLDIIPANEYYNITDLMHDIKAKGLKVGVFPVSEKSWVDIGQWEEYKKAISIMSI